ncbi:MAG: Bifunctional adenosylcobalamin biosynthesis protein cobP [Paenibacillaceae bacterium]|nr:Bifunctional adenosylcobalamin biosynthesis protein cobP [Paenibacillaceae bacterium]
MLVLITGGARSGKSGFAEQYAVHLGDHGYYVATSQVWDEETEERVALHRLLRENSGFFWETVEEPLLLAEILEKLGTAAEDADRSLEADKDHGAGQQAWAAGQIQDGDHLRGAEQSRDVQAVYGACYTASTAHVQGAAPGNGKRSVTGKPVILIDCLTLWLTNLLLADGQEEWDREARRAVAVSVDAAVDRLIAAAKAQSAPVLLVSNEVGSGIVPEYPLGRLFRDLAGRMNRRIAAESDQVFLVTAGIPVELKRLAFRLPGRFCGADGN